MEYCEEILKVWVKVISETEKKLPLIKVCYEHNLIDLIN